MSGNDLATTGSQLPANPADLLSGLQNMGAAAAIDSKGGKGQFMRFSKGDYIFGTDDTVIEEGSLWAVNPGSFTHGYQVWGDGKLLGEEVATMNEAPIVKSNLPIHTYIDPDTKKEVAAQWNPLRGFILVCTNGEDVGIQCYLSGTSLGFNNAANGLVEEIVSHMGEDPSTPVPIVSLDGDSYKHKKYGKVHIPVLKVEDWATMDATVVPESEDDAPNDDAPDVDEVGDAAEAAAIAAEEAKAAEKAEAKETADAKAEKKEPRGRRGAAKADEKPTGKRRTRRQSRE